jgi:beta-aspartyl-peptidase (threonine type)
MVLANCVGGVGFQAAVRTLLQGGNALAAVEAGICVVEADPGIHSVGLGGRPNLLGQVECDAAIMDGRTLQAGSVGALRGYRHAITVARGVMERLPHVLLVGQGAERFALEIGAEAANMVTSGSLHEHQRWLQTHISAATEPGWPDVPLASHAWTSAQSLRLRGTTCFLAIDEHGDIAGGASSSGWAGKYPGRVGDSGIIGAGLYVDNGSGGCGCTHSGEMTIRAGTGKSVVLYLKTRVSVREACVKAAADLRRLETGYLGPVIIHAVDRHGSPCVLSTEDLGDDMWYYYWQEGMAARERAPAHVVAV